MHLVEVCDVGFYLFPLWIRIAIAITRQLYSQFLITNEIRQCVHSNESYYTVLSCGAVYYAVDEILKCDHSNNS